MGRRMDAAEVRGNEALWEEEAEVRGTRRETVTRRCVAGGRGGVAGHVSRLEVACERWRMRGDKESGDSERKQHQHYKH